MGICSSSPASVFDTNQSSTPPPSSDSALHSRIALRESDLHQTNPHKHPQLEIVVPTAQLKADTKQSLCDNNTLQATVLVPRLEPYESVNSTTAIPDSFPVSPSFFSNSTDCGVTPSRTQQTSIDLSTPVVRKYTDSLVTKELAIPELSLSPVGSPRQPQLLPRKVSKSPSPLCLETLAALSSNRSASTSTRKLNATVDKEAHEVDSCTQPPQFLEAEGCANLDSSEVASFSAKNARGRTAFEDISHDTPIDAIFIDPIEVAIPPDALRSVGNWANHAVPHPSLPSSTIFIPTSPTPLETTATTAPYDLIPESPAGKLLSSSSVFVPESTTSIPSKLKPERLPIMCHHDLRSIKSPRPASAVLELSACNTQDQISSPSASPDVVKLIRRPKGAKWKKRSEEVKPDNKEGHVATTPKSITVIPLNLEEKPAVTKVSHLPPPLAADSDFVPLVSTNVVSPSTAVERASSNEPDAQTSDNAMSLAHFDVPVGIIKPRALKPIVIPITSQRSNTEPELTRQYQPPLPPRSPLTSPIKILYHPTNPIKFVQAPATSYSDFPRQYFPFDTKENYFADSVQFQTTIPTDRTKDTSLPQSTNPLPGIDLSLIHRFKPLRVLSEPKQHALPAKSLSKHRYSRSLVEHWKEPADYSCNIPARFGTSSVSIAPFENHTVLELFRMGSFNWGNAATNSAAVARIPQPSGRTIDTRESKSVDLPEPAHKNPFIHPYYLPYLDLNMTSVPTQPVLLPISMHRRITHSSGSKYAIPASSLNLQPVTMKRTMELLRARRKQQEVAPKASHPTHSAAIRPLTPNCTSTFRPSAHSSSRPTLKSKFASKFTISIPPLDLKKIPKFHSRSRPSSAGNILYDSSRKQEPLFPLTPKPPTIASAFSVQSNRNSNKSNVAAVTAPLQPLVDRITTEAPASSKLPARPPSPSRLLIRAAKPSSANISSLLQQLQQDKSPTSSVDSSVVRSIPAESKFIHDVRASDSIIQKFCEALSKQVQEQQSVDMLKLFIGSPSSNATEEVILEERALRVLDCLNIKTNASSSNIRSGPGPGIRVAKLEVADVSSEAIVRSIMQLIGSGLTNTDFGAAFKASQPLQVRSLTLRLNFPSVEKHSPHNLHFQACKSITHVILSGLAHASSFESGLVHLDLSQSDFGSNGIATLLAALKRMKHLQTLSLVSCNLGATSGRFVQVASQHPSLASLDISLNDIKNAELSQITLALLHPLCRLTDLNLSLNSITEVGLQMLCNSLMRKSVPPVPYPVDQLSSTKSSQAVSGPGPLTAEFLRRSQTRGLKKLSLEGNDLSGSMGVEALAQWLQHSSCCLTELNISYCKLSSSGLKSICGGIRHSSLLTSFNIAGNLALPVGTCEQVGSSCIELLSQNSCLRELDLRDNQLLNHWIGIPVGNMNPSSLLKALLRFTMVHPTIETLHVSGNGLSRDETAEIQAHMKKKAAQRRQSVSSNHQKESVLHSTQLQSHALQASIRPASVIHSCAPASSSTSSSHLTSPACSLATRPTSAAARPRTDIIPLPIASNSALAKVRDEYRNRKNKLYSSNKSEVATSMSLSMNANTNGPPSSSNSAIPITSSFASLHTPLIRSNSASRSRMPLQSTSNRAPVKARAGVSRPISNLLDHSSNSNTADSAHSIFHSISSGPLSYKHSSSSYVSSLNFAPRRTNLADDLARLRLEKTLTSEVTVPVSPTPRSQSSTSSSKYLAGKSLV